MNDQRTELVKLRSRVDGMIATMDAKKPQRDRARARVHALRIESDGARARVRALNLESDAFFVKFDPSDRNGIDKYQAKDHALKAEISVGLAKIDRAIKDFTPLHLILARVDAILVSLDAMQANNDRIEWANLKNVSTNKILLEKVSRFNNEVKPDVLRAENDAIEAENLVIRNENFAVRFAYVGLNMELRALRAKIASQRG